MSHQDLLESFRTAYQNLQLLPLLTQEEFNKFGVEYGTDVIDELEQFMEDCTPGADKLIFTGHRGCGKSTLLTEFCRRMDDRYFVVFFSIADLIELSDVNHVNILFAIAMQLMDAARKRKVSIQQTTEKVFYEWLGTYTRTEVPAKEN
jgi:GTPase SAR1 family protein